MRNTNAGNFIKAPIDARVPHTISEINETCSTYAKSSSTEN